LFSLQDSKSSKNKGNLKTKIKTKIIGTLAKKPIEKSKKQTSKKVLQSVKNIEANILKCVSVETQSSSPVSISNSVTQVAGTILFSFVGLISPFCLQTPDNINEQIHTAKVSAESDLTHTLDVAPSERALTGTMTEGLAATPPLEFSSSVVSLHFATKIIFELKV
jgi:hypothetical protein